MTKLRGKSMFVTKMETGSVGLGEIITDPSWEAVETAIRKMDGDTCDSIALDGPSDSYMGVAGGADGQYVVAGFLHGFGSFICASGESNGQPKEVVVTGDYNIYPSPNVVGIEVVLEASKAFCERGVLCENLKWEKQRK